MKPAQRMLGSLKWQSEGLLIRVYRRLPELDFVLCCVEAADLFAVEVVETIDEIAEQVIDQDGRCLVEHRQIDRERDGPGL